MSEFEPRYSPETEDGDREMAPAVEVRSVVKRPSLYLVRRADDKVRSGIELHNWFMDNGDLEQLPEWKE